MLAPTQRKRATPADKPRLVIKSASLLLLKYDQWVIPLCCKIERVYWSDLGMWQSDRKPSKSAVSILSRGSGAGKEGKSVPDRLLSPVVVGLNWGGGRVH
jgi:hypothetical protein